MKIAVTGSSGILGAGVVTFVLSNTSHNLILIDSKPPKDPIDDPRITYKTANLLDYATFLEVIQGADALIHLAAFAQPGHVIAATTHSTNVTLSYNALQAAVDAGIKRVAMASSINAIGAYWNPFDPTFDYFPIDEKHPIRCADPYSLSKYIGEIQADAIARAHSDMSITSLRCHALVTEKRDLTPWIPEAKKDLWGWTSLESAARAFLLSLEVDWKGHETLFIVGEEHCVPGHDASDLAKTYYPEAENRGLSGDQGFFDCSKAERVLGWKHTGGKQPRSS